MRSEEICTGLSVRVSSSSGSAQKQNGKIGTVVHIYGNPSYVAVDVAFDDGSSDLFWHYQVDNHENGYESPRPASDAIRHEKPRPANYPRAEAHGRQTARNRL